MQACVALMSLVLALVTAPGLFATPRSVDHGVLVLIADGEIGLAEEGRTVTTGRTRRPPPRGQRYQLAPHPGIPIGEDRLKELKNLYSNPPPSSSGRSVGGPPVGEERCVDVHVLDGDGACGSAP
jgi:hypothetical protein